MKKIGMTLVAVAFSCSFVFAQTGAPIQDKQNDISVQEQAKKREVKMKDLPLAVQETMKEDAYSQMEVLAVYLKPSGKEEPAVFEFELAKTEGSTSSTGSPEAGLDGVELERVSNRQPDIILLVDENGAVLKENEPLEEK